MAPCHPAQYVPCLHALAILLNQALTGIFHKVTMSDVYEGHFIPAGSTVIPNVWYVPYPSSESFGLS